MKNVTLSGEDLAKALLTGSTPYIYIEDQF